MINQIISHFKILKKLGEGGMGVVYKAEDIQLERTVAIKFLPDEIAVREEARRRFKIEAKAAAALNHPNIATVYQVEEVDDQMFIVMEYIDGKELREIVGVGGPVSPVQALKIAIQIGEGLQAAHQKGIVHRDIKSANIMLTRDGRVKIMDFGLARIAGKSGITKEGATLGTVAYMSPEQAGGEAVDQRSDIWSFGVLFYEMLSGQRPFQAEYEQAILYVIMNVDPTPIAEIIGSADEPLQPVLDKMLAKEPKDRYQDMKAVLADLREISGESAPRTEMQEIVHHTVGRDKEFVALQEGLHSVFSGKGFLLGIAGEPGIGKTTLVEQFLNDVKIARKPCLIAKGQCSERLAGTEAYLPFLEALESLLRNVAGDAAELMRERAPWWYVQVASLSPDDPANTAILADVRNATQERVKRELASFMQEASIRQPLLLLFEDLHWADVSTIDMLAYLAAGIDATRLLFVATYRPEEMRLTDHPFLQIKPDLLARNRFREISLGFLPQHEIEHYLSLEYPENGFPDTFAALIHDKTEGSPLFMVDLLESLQNRNVIMKGADCWGLSHSVEEIQLELPDSVKGMIDRKIQQLSEEDLRLMTAASIQGFEFDSAVIGKVLVMDEEEVEDRLLKLEKDHRFVHFTEEVEFPDRTLTLRYRFVHALYQNELYDSLTRTRRARLSRATAETLERFYGEKRDKVAGELASLYEAAREFEKSVDFFGKAAEQAMAVFAYREAIALIRRGLELLNTLPESQQRNKIELALQITLGSAATAVYGYANQDVRDTYLRIRQLIDGGNATSDDILATFGLHSFFLSTLGMEEAVNLCKWWLDLARRDEDLTLLFAGNGIIAVTYNFIGDFDASIKHFEQAFTVYDPKIDSRLAFVSGQDVVLATWNNYPWNLWLRGYPDQAAERSLEAAKLAEKRSDPHVITHRYLFAAWLYICFRDPEKVLELSEANISLSEEHGLPWPLTVGQLQKGWALTQTGKIEEGLTMMNEGDAMFRAMGFDTWRQIWHAEMAETYGRIGQPEKGLELLAESLEVVGNTLHRMWAAELHRIKGELLLISDQAETEAESSFQNALEVAHKQQAKSFELRAAISQGRLWQTQGRNNEAKNLINKAFNWFTEGFETKDLQDAKQLLQEL